MLATEQLTIDKAERVCKWYFRIGFCFMPWMWAALWYFFSLHQSQSNVIAWYVRMSFRLFIFNCLFYVFIYFAFLLLVPSTSKFWIIPPFTGQWQPGYFATPVE
ncbi:unnamed protein product [Phytomonas sp. Hart1]|nr:unnamed protein product [Phytomonas sp. Hart1]|eukprot:CCW71469.1 unnamed protein product [Phytomonas sp. isolate Hart1]